MAMVTLFLVGSVAYVHAQCIDDPMCGLSPGCASSNSVFTVRIKADRPPTDDGCNKAHQPNNNAYPTNNNNPNNIVVVGNNQRLNGVSLLDFYCTMLINILCKLETYEYLGADVRPRSIQIQIPSERPVR